MLEFQYIERGLLHDRTRLTQVTGVILQVRNTGKIITGRPTDGKTIFSKTSLMLLNVKNIHS